MAIENRIKRGFPVKGDEKKPEPKKEAEEKREARRITIECVENEDGSGDGYIVTWENKLTAAEKKKNKEGTCSPCSMEGMDDNKRVFESEEATLEFVKGKL